MGKRKTKVAQVAKDSERKLKVVLHLLFVVVVLIFFRNHIFGTRYFSDDFVEQFYPFQTFSARYIASLELPYWNPYTFSGMPFLADLQNGVFYPPYWLFALSVGDDGKVSVTMLQIVIILHLFVALYGIFFLLRYLQCTLWGSALGAIIYAFSSPFLFHMIHPMIVIHLSWFPWIFLFLHRSIVERNIRYALSAGLIAGLAFLSGHPQMALYMLFFLACYALFLFIREKFSVRIFLALSITVLVAFGVFAIQFFPTYVLYENAERKEITYEFASEGSYPPEHFLTLFVPNFFGTVTPHGSDYPYLRKQAFYYWETIIYPGIAALFLTFFGMWKYRQEPLVQFLTAFFIFAFLFALGKHFFLHRIFFLIPGFGTFRIPARMLFFVPFLSALISGRTFSGFWDKRRPYHRTDHKIIRVLYIVFGSILLSSILFFPNLFDIPRGYAIFARNYSVVALLLFAAVVLVIELILRKRINHHYAGFLLILICVVDFYWNEASFNDSRVHPERLYDIPQNVKAIFQPKFPEDIFRVKMREGSIMAMRRNQGPVDSIMLVEGYNPLLLKRRQPPLPNRDDHWKVLNVRYEIVVDDNQQQYHFREREKFFPRARMLYRARYVPDSLQFHFFQDGRADINREVVVADSIPFELSGKSPDSVQHSIQCLSYKDAEIVYKVETEEAGILWLSEIWYPEWRVEVDGNPAKLYRVDYGFRGVALPAGQHTVRIYYDPRSLYFGLTMTLSTLLIVFVTLLFFKRRSRNRSEAVEAQMSYNQ